jgi:hypothetical protein
MRASTQHLIDAVSALALAVKSSTDEIAEQVQNVLNAKNDGDDEAIEAAANRIKELTGNLSAAVDASNAAIASVPTGPAGDAPATPPATDPAAAPPDQATQTGVDPASGAPAGQGAVQAGQG